jgi:hypothetical protein
MSDIHLKHHTAVCSIVAQLPRCSAPLHCAAVCGRLCQNEMTWNGRHCPSPELSPVVFTSATGDALLKTNGVLCSIVALLPKSAHRCAASQRTTAQCGGALTIITRGGNARNSHFCLKSRAALQRMSRL